MTTQSTPTSTVTSLDPPKQGHPIAFLFFFWGEFAERASYYGMRAILPMYLTMGLHMSDAVGGRAYFWFKTACYGLPLLGGYLADRYFGKYRTIVGFSIPYVLGHFILGIESIPAAAIALILLAGGSGVIKPNISTLMGETYDQQRPGQTQLRSAAFMWFYFAINVGALISTLSLPYLRDNYGYATAFQFPAWLMVVSLAVFASGKRHYAKETLAYQPPTPEQRVERRATVQRLLGIFGLIVLFFIPYEHNDSIWVFFARDYINLGIDFRAVPLLNSLLTPSWLQFTLPPDQLQFLNPLCVMIFAPLFAWLFPKLDPDARLFTARTKILIGFAFGVCSSAVMTFAGFLANAETKISVVWLVAAYVLLTIAEVLVYGTGLDLAFSAAPPSMKGFITGCFLLTSTVANFFNGFWVDFYGGSMTTEANLRGPLSPGMFFGVSGLFVLAAMIVMLTMNRDAEPERPIAA